MFFIFFGTPRGAYVERIVRRIAGLRNQDDVGVFPRSMLQTLCWDIVKLIGLIAVVSS